MKGKSIHGSLDGHTAEHRELEGTTHFLLECRREVQQSLQLKPTSVSLWLLKRSKKGSATPVRGSRKSWGELSQAIRRMITDVCSQQKFFMIDGFDECSGEHIQLIELIQDLEECTGT